MSKFIKPISTLIAAMALSAPAIMADGADALPMAPEQYRSSSFEAVASRLDLGGTNFNYMDFGDATKELGTNLSEFMHGMSQMTGDADPTMMMLGMMPLQQIVDTLGVSNLAAFGSSSYWDGSVYHNKSVIQMPEGVKGIFTITGDSAHAFNGLKLAPESTDVFLEFDFKSSALEDMIKTVAQQMYGDQSDQFVQGMLGVEVSPSGATWADVLAKSNTTATLVVELGPMQTIESDEMGEIQIPSTQAVLKLSDMAWLIDDGLIPSDAMTVAEEDGMKIYREPADSEEMALMPEGWDRAIVTQGADIYFVNNVEFLKTCNAEQSTLANNADFKQATEGFPEQGNVLLFISKDAANAFVAFRDSLAQSTPEFQSIMPIYDFILPIMNIEKQDAALARITTVDATSIYTSSRWPVPHTGAGSMSTVPTIGVMAAMAIPAFNKVREQSREKTIMNNLRQIASAGYQYILEEGETSVTYGQLEGEYFNAIVPVDGEDYTNLVISENGGVLEVTTQSGVTVTYTY